MKLYHASNISIPSPDVDHSRPALDFGKGFYLTTIREQAVNYGRRFLRRRQVAWLNSYEFQLTQEQPWRIIEFKEYDAEWLSFIAKCRKGIDNSNYYFIIGGIADDKVIFTLDRYFAGEIGEQETLGQLKYHKPNIQYCIRNQMMLDECLNFLGSEQL